MSRFVKIKASYETVELDREIKNDPREAVVKDHSVVPAGVRRRELRPRRETAQ